MPVLIIAFFLHVLPMLAAWWLVAVITAFAFGRAIHIRNLNERR